MNSVVLPRNGYSKDAVKVIPKAMAKKRNALAEFVRCVNIANRISTNQNFKQVLFFPPSLQTCGIEKRFYFHPLAGNIGFSPDRLSAIDLDYNRA